PARGGRPAGVAPAPGDQRYRGAAPRRGGRFLGELRNCLERRIGIRHDAAAGARGLRALQSEARGSQLRDGLRLRRDPGAEGYRATAVSGLMNRLGDQAVLQTLQPVLGAVTAFLHAAEWRIRMRHGDGVDADHARLEGIADQHGALAGLREGVSGETVWQAVGLLDGLIEAREWCD